MWSQQRFAQIIGKFLKKIKYNLEYFFSITAYCLFIVLKYTFKIYLKHISSREIKQNNFLGKTQKDWKFLKIIFYAILKIG